MNCKSERRASRGPMCPAHLSSLPLRYRIQCRDEDSNSWREYAHFRYPGEAEACLNLLFQRGIDARMQVHQTLVRVDPRV